jgi:predicted amidophosphoribosyltransferase
MLIYKVFKGLFYAMRWVSGAMSEALSLLAFPFSRRVPTCSRCGAAAYGWGNGACPVCGSRCING